MSSINSHYTFNYSQPSEYRLSHDSVFLARQIFERTSDRDFSEKRALDICAGAGVVGMDFLFHRRAAKQSVPCAFDFLEIQEIYLPHFEENRLRMGPVGCRLNFLCQNYDQLQRDEFRNVYDLIVCNPPYFLPQQGKLSPSHFKNRCKFFLDSSLEKLLLGVANCLASDGNCFMTLRDLTEHGFDTLAVARNLVEDKLVIEKSGEIRGTLFLKLTALP